MINKQVISLIICFSVAATAASQTVLFINAGARSRLGRQQELQINRNGECKYFSGELYGVVKDSSFFTIPTARLDSFFNDVLKSGFFDIDNSYGNGYDTGSGIYVSLNIAGKIKRVWLVNTELREMNEFLDQLNSMLSDRGLRIDYRKELTAQ